MEISDRETRIRKKSDAAPHFLLHACPGEAATCLGDGDTLLGDGNACLGDGDALPEEGAEFARALSGPAG